MGSLTGQPSQRWQWWWWQQWWWQWWRWLQRYLWTMGSLTGQPSGKRKVSPRYFTSNHNLGHHNRHDHNQNHLENQLLWKYLCKVKFNLLDWKAISWIQSTWDWNKRKNYGFVGYAHLQRCDRCSRQRLRRQRRRRDKKCCFPPFWGNNRRWWDVDEKEEEEEVVR